MELKKDRLEKANHSLDELLINWRSLLQKRKKILVIRKKIELRVESVNNYQETKMNKKILRRISVLFLCFEEKNEFLLIKINKLGHEKLDLKYCIHYTI